MDWYPPRFSFESELVSGEVGAGEDGMENGVGSCEEGRGRLTDGEWVG